jgi:hypothetical protein
MQFYLFPISSILRAGFGVLWKTLRKRLLRSWHCFGAFAAVADQVFTAAARFDRNQPVTTISR